MGKGDEKDKEKKSKDKSKDKVDKDKKADKIDKKSKDKADKAEKPDKSEKKADKKDDKKSKDKPKKKDEPKVVKALRKEYDAFIESDAETAQIGTLEVFPSFGVSLLVLPELKGSDSKLLHGTHNVLAVCVCPNKYFFKGSMET
jgi:hypothetical protein